MKNNKKIMNTNETVKKVKSAKAYFIYSVGKGFLMTSESSLPTFGYGEQMMVFATRAKARFAIEFMVKLYPDTQMDIIGKVG